MITHYVSTYDQVVLRANGQHRTAASIRCGYTHIAIALVDISRPQVYRAVLTASSFDAEGGIGAPSVASS